MILGSQREPCDTAGQALCSSLTGDELVRLHIEVQLNSSSSAAVSDVLASLSRVLELSGVLYRDGPVPFDSDSFLQAHVASISVCDVDEEAAGSQLGQRLFVWQMDPLIQCAPLTRALTLAGQEPQGWWFKFGGLG